MEDLKIKHLEFIQNVINRLASNSFQIKGWCILLVTSLFALSANSNNIAFIFLAYIPTFIFWGLDGYFLSMERRYRKLYDIVRKSNDDIDFSLNTNHLADEDDTLKWVSAVRSKTIYLFYGSLIVAIIIVIFIQS